MTIKCSFCWLEKDESNFYKNSRSKTWYRSYCKDCNRERYREQDKARRKRYYYSNLEENRKKARDRRRENPQQWRKWFTSWAKRNKEYNILRRTYYSLKRRCENSSDRKYHIYWWRWIKCEWSSLKDFISDMGDSFYAHIEEYWTGRKNCQIDRIDNNWNYCKDNCRWVTCKENNPHNHFKELGS